MTIARCTALFVALSTLFACAPIVHSVRGAAAESQAGFSYFLPKQHFHLTVTRTVDDKCNAEHTAKVTLLDAIPDADYRFVAQLNHLVTREETLKITADERGLLSSADATAEDKLPEILAAVARIAAPLTKANQFLRCPEPFTYHAIFDPADDDFRKELGKTKRELARSGFEMNLKITALFARDAQTLHIAPVVPGLVYRRPLPYLVDLEVDGAMPLASIFMLPNEGAIEVLPFDGGLAVKTIANAKFVGGVPTSWDANRPSEILSIANAPLDAAKAIVSVPAELLRFKVDVEDKTIKE